MDSDFRNIKGKGITMEQQETPAFKQLKEQLREIFQLDRGDLDFGLYRIMNQKRDEVTEFLDKQLLPQVSSVLKEYQPAGGANAQDELNKMIASLTDAGVDPETSPKVQELRAKLSQSVDLFKLEQEIYSDLHNFFKRYYSDGDFMSMRRYKEGVYALPYEGEEVKLHWANHDQYYIKTSEDLKNYSFKTTGNKRVRFEVVDGGTETNNNKAAEGKERRFILHADAPIQSSGDGLTIRFEYRPSANKNKKQADLNQESVEQLLSLAEISAFGLTEAAPTEKNKDRTLLEKHLNDFTAKNSFDYFIHKDLGKFLTRELDFYIKNEIMHLDDIENETAPKVESYLAKVKAMRKVAGKIIQFLAHLEDFQKKLWLKKKFVLETHYCITLDHIIGSDVEDALLPIIAANDAQREEWVKLFAIDDVDGYATPLTFDFLKANDKLLVDTKFFDMEFKYTLLSIFDDLDEQTDGLLINSENFQALNLLQERYKEKVKCIYIDPPYNTDANAILYKNNYKHSSWVSLMDNRLPLSASYLKQTEGVQIIAIDDAENARLQTLIEQRFHDKTITPVSVIHNPSGTIGKNFSKSGEYALFIHNDSIRTIAMENRSDSPDVRDLMNSAKGSSGNYLRSTGKTCFYPVLVKDNQIIGFGDVCGDDFHPDRNMIKAGGVTEVYPIDSDNVERKWVLSRDTVEKEKSKLKVKTDNTGLIRIMRYKDEINFKTVWFETEKKYSAKKYGTELLGDMVPITREIPPLYPKSLHLVKDCIFAGLNKSKDDIVFDFFAGSGTSAHATIELNREDNGDRKYILFEMGLHYQTVTKPRVLKALYSPDWKKGKPVSRDGISHVIKYMALEQYEDTLDNLGLSKSEAQSALLFSNPSLNEQYMLGYMLDVESRGSQSLLNIDDFADPFAYTLRITRNDDTQVVNVDLVETFNYLLGLTVRTVDRDKSSIVTITGKNSLGENCLIIWRNTGDVDSNALDDWFKSYSVKNFEFDAIYVNGDNNIENMKMADQTWKVRLIELEFKRLMFDLQDV